MKIPKYNLVTALYIIIRRSLALIRLHRSRAHNCTVHAHIIKTYTHRERKYMNVLSYTHVLMQAHMRTHTHGCTHTYAHEQTHIECCYIPIILPQQELHQFCYMLHAAALGASNIVVLQQYLLCTYAGNSALLKFLTFKDDNIGMHAYAWACANTRLCSVLIN